MSVGLTFEDVEHHIACLPRDVRDRLALGPIADDDPAEQPGCRVCDALGEGGERLTAHGVYATPREKLHAHELWAWHDVGAVDLIEFAIEVDSRPRAEGGLDLDRDALAADDTPSDLLREVLGALSYARCCTIYALAQASMKHTPER